ncbi:MAG: isoleucine--tRNA ligase [Candidatus Sumerlaeaceae bacterium]
MRANLAQREPEILARWKKERLYEKLQARPAQGEFILHDGPPYANGHIHIGHALNKILKDIVVRYHSMLGKRAPYVPGWDCHGLPIEQKVSGELGPRKAEKTALEIRHLCEEYALKWARTQSEEFQRLGVQGDWEHPYLTLQPEVEVGIVGALRDLVAGGYIYKGMKPVFWCAECQTALADAEVEYEQHTSHSIYVKFPIIAPEQRPAVADLTRPSIVIWTTTPWTLPANLAISLHPDFVYVALRVKGPDGQPEDYIVAKDLAQSFARDAQIGDYEIVKELRASDLELLKCEHPVQPDKTSKVILGTHVTAEQGTGAVHTAPGHGMEDFVVCQAYGIPTFVPVDAKGCFTSDFQLMEGMNVWEANGPIIRYLDERDLLVKAGTIEHSYPHCWRCHQPIIYRATEQWFLRVDHNELRTKALKFIDEAIEWIPKWGHDRIYNMMATRPDWCLSRQRVWGVPIPAVICKQCRRSTLDVQVIERFMEHVAKRGTNVWFEAPVETFLPDGFQCPACGATQFDKEDNILDVWFDSGSTHLAVLERRQELRWPADLYLEGSDQHRGWFQSSLIVALGTRQAPPYRAVLTHGFVLDGKGEAMSKSKGNVIAPEQVIAKYGADVLRLWVASQDYRGDCRVSQEILERVGEAYRRIRNTFRFLLGNLSDFDPAQHTVPYGDLLEIDRWILHELFKLNKQVRQAYADYEFHKIYHWLHEFCVVQLSAIYLDIIKDRLYCSGANSPERRAAQTTQYYLFHHLVRLAAPILVFTTDEAFTHLSGTGPSVHLDTFLEPDPQWEQPSLSEEWQQLLEVRGEVLRALEDARQVKRAIGQSLEACVALMPKSPQWRALLERHTHLLAEIFITSQAEIVDEAIPEETIVTSFEGTTTQVFVAKALGNKCERCWRVLPSVGKDADYPTICDRCANVVRRYYNG